MKRVSAVLFVTMLAGQAWSQEYNYRYESEAHSPLYKFSAVCSSGQTLYYGTSYGSYTAYITRPDLYSGYRGYEKPEGNLIIPETVTYEGETYIVTRINNDAFEWCQELTSVTIPNSITEIGENAFFGCTGLASVTIKSEASPKKAYLSFKKGNIRYRVISKNEVSVDRDKSDSRYSGNIVIPSKVTSGNTFSVVWIAPNAFKASIDLTSVAIPNSITRIGEGAFESCIHLTAIYCQAKAKPSGWDDNWNPNKYKVVWGAVNKFK